MEELGKTVRILFQNGEERTFTHVVVDEETAGWLMLIRGKRVQLFLGCQLPLPRIVCRP